MNKLGLIVSATTTVLVGHTMGIHITEADLITPKPIATGLFYGALIYVNYKVGSAITNKLGREVEVKPYVRSDRHERDRVAYWAGRCIIRPQEVPTHLEGYVQEWLDIHARGGDPVKEHSLFT